MGVCFVRTVCGSVGPGLCRRAHSPSQSTAALYTPPLLPASDLGSGSGCSVTPLRLAQRPPAQWLPGFHPLVPTS